MAFKIKYFYIDCEAYTVKGALYWYIIINCVNFSKIDTIAHTFHLRVAYVPLFLGGDN